MAFLKKQRNLKRVHPGSLIEAFRLCKEHAREKKNLSVERIAELMDASPDALYKWLSKASMPSGKIQAYEHICGIRLVSEYLAASGNRIVIEIPAGRLVEPIELNELQAVINDAMGKLIRFYDGTAERDVTEACLSAVIMGAAWHRENVRKAEQPELDLGGRS